MSWIAERYEKLGYSMKEAKLQPCIRVNTQKISTAELFQRLKEKRVRLKKVEFLENAFYVESTNISLSALQEHLQGYYYIQEAAAQLPAEVLGPEGIILDCCASPGGKTTQLALKAKIVVALESQYKRVSPLLNNIERLGIRNCIVYNLDARTFEPDFKFDKILVDAPCSGNFVLDNNWVKRQSISNFERNANTQEEILRNIVSLLKDDGELVYSTCSLEPEEDEMIVDWAIKELGLRVMKINCIGDEGLTNVFGSKLDSQVKNCRRLWPSKTKTQGFFIAKLRK